ncbi:PRD domain-containing protein [Erysipelothrix sp. HDW6C]|uniref:PRD domain-containing protein n=1 Tax=Erysipelothrix sp. HDW6C TaxID=2714930 RepID=UPI0014097F00|nr:PRD domain-containing protein [Erysipelothrix sp. HDW6C]QIK70409.1 PRD domain-containing protein [Erysipelothrix sp. HDW6C]
MEERLKVLRENNIIDQDVHDYCLNVYEGIIKREGLDSSAAEVLLTHLAMATQRIRNDDVVNAMDDFILDEIKMFADFERVQVLTTEILTDGVVEFPDSEMQFIWLHLSNVLRENGGDN